MASFVSIQVSSANATLVPWSVVSLDPSQRFLDLFSSIQAGKFSIIRTSSELSAAVLESVCIRSDKSNLLLAWLNTPGWASIREATEGLAQALDSYVLYLRKQNKKMKIHHSAPVAEVVDKTSVTLLQANPAPSKSVHKLIRYLSIVNYLCLIMNNEK